MQISEQKTYDCEPTLTDSQVLEFCKTGYLMFEGVVPDEINRRFSVPIFIYRLRWRIIGCTVR